MTDLPHDPIRNTYNLTGFNQILGDFYIFFAWARISTRMIVGDQNPAAE
jgi:hypothetical protein